MLKKQIKRLLLLGVILPLAGLASAADDPFDWSPADCERKYLFGPNGVFLGIYCDFFPDADEMLIENVLDDPRPSFSPADYTTVMLTDVNDVIPLEQTNQFPQQVIADLYEAVAVHPESFRVLIFKAIVSDPWKEEAGIAHEEEWFVVKISEEQQYVFTGLREDRGLEIFVKPQGLFELPEITFMKTENVLLNPGVSDGNNCSVIGSWGILPQFCSIAPPPSAGVQEIFALNFKVLTFGKAGLPIVADELDLTAEEIAEFEALIEEARDRTVRVLIFRTGEGPRATGIGPGPDELKIAILTDRQSIVLQTLGYERKFSLLLKKERRHFFRTFFPRVPVLITDEITPTT